MAIYTVPDLPYDYAALEPHISGKIMQLHHDKHHAAYVAGANAALEGLAAARDSGDLANVNRFEKDLAFNLGGHVNHSIFWTNLSPDGGGQPEGELKAAIDEFFGRPHSGRDWDDVAMYWAYVLYMMGAEERIIPKNGDEMRKMTDYIYANGGMSSSFRVEIATALMSVLEELDEKLPVQVLAGLSTIIGEHDTRFMVKDTKWENANIKVLAAAFTVKAKAEAAIARVKDRLPGAEQRKIRKAHDGRPPWMDILELQEKHIRDAKLNVKSDYTLHDNSAEAQR